MSETSDRIGADCPACGQPQPDDAPCGCEGTKARTSSLLDELEDSKLSWARVIDGPLKEKATLRLHELESDDDDDVLDATAHEGWGRYQIHGKLGEGGMGVVYLATDTELGRKVAIKVLQVPEHTDEDIQRFLIEARVTSQLTHPNIVPVHEIGTTPQGELFYTMKRVRGRELSQVMEDGELSTVRLVQILIDACHAIEYAHARGVLHRDIKPENLLVGDYGELLVADWGLALLLDGSRAKHPSVDPYASRPRLGSGGGTQGNARLTQIGEVIGTIAYMAPEQARGDQHLIGPETDIYALGAVLFEILTDRPPYVFDRDTPPREMLIEVAEGRMPAPSELDPRVPSDLAAIAMKALQQRIGDRYRKVGDLRADLEAFVENRPVSAHRAGPLFRLGKLIDRHRGIFWTGLLALIALVGGAILFGVLQWQKQIELQSALGDIKRERDNTGRALSELKQAIVDRDRAKAERERIVQADNRLTTAEFLLQNDPASEQALETIQQVVADAPGYYRGHYLLGRTLAAHGKPAEALAAIKRCLACRAGFVPALWVRAEILEAQLQSQREASLRTAIEGRLTATYGEIVRLAPDSGTGHTALGRLAMRAGRPKEAIGHFETAIKRRGKNIAEAHASLAALYIQVKDLARARQHWQAAAREARDQFAQSNLRRVMGQLGSSPARRADEAFERGQHEFRTGDFDDAQREFERAAKGYARVANREGQRLYALQMVGRCQGRRGQHARAVTTLEAIIPRLLDQRDLLGAAQVRFYLGTFALSGRRPERAASALAAATQAYLESDKVEEGSVTAAYLAEALLALGEIGEARRRLIGALEWVDRVPEHLYADRIRRTEGRLLRHEGRPEQAAEVFGALLKRRWVARSPVRALPARLGLARCLVEMNRPDEAETMLAEIEVQARKLRQHGITGEAVFERAELVRRERGVVAAYEHIRTSRIKGTLVERRLGELAFLAGQTEVARKHLQAARKSASDPIRIDVYLALLKVAGGQKTPLAGAPEALIEDAPWPAPILRHLHGKATLGEVRAAAERHPVYQMDVAYVLGELSLIAGRRLKAKKQFELVRDGQLLDRAEYRNALDRLGQLAR